MKSITVRGRSLIEQRNGTSGTGKEWVYWNGIPVSFEELYYIVRWIGRLEDIKYPEAHQEGANMVDKFLKDAIFSWKTYDELAMEYKLPPSKGTIDNSQMRWEFKGI